MSTSWRLLGCFPGVVAVLEGVEGGEEEEDEQVDSEAVTIPLAVADVWPQTCNLPWLIRLRSENAKKCITAIPCTQTAFCHVCAPQTCTRRCPPPSLR